ncbi:GNAT family N-acetyltransferase [Halalkalibacter hemicellulosilyticus]|uniref:Ribosomal-protein-alanine acetyltransferase n=1 Tax=Halalkalibacter hemicellulosilyticusJCM 9152 TaxID=1236971 RepID=W4QJ88_9BACI|nr:GNAT family N-acetyltransferase [Halalkalibacter hemicellulosilyticus]GAE32185.1 ribosomal-protein-alanine acetyltransferase [Halalkalibacter hemicellulosilyticusJCM 9152]
MKTTLETERLQLRKMKTSDAPYLFNIWSDPTVTRYMNISDFESVEQATAMITHLNQLANEHQAIRYSIILQKTGDIIGSCGFNHFDFTNERAEIGYELGKHYWGQGYANEAISTIIDYGFKELALNRIEAKVELENESSVKLLKRLNFTYEGLLRQVEKYEGAFHDLALYSTLACEQTNL